MSQILVVEDDTTFRSIIVAALHRYGYSVVEAADGRAGLALLEAHVVDVIITDLLMPDLDGIEMITELRKRKSSIPIIAITGRLDDADVYISVAKVFGAQRVLRKPFVIDDLIEAVREILPA